MNVCDSTKVTSPDLHVGGVCRGIEGVMVGDYLKRNQPFMLGILYDFIEFCRESAGTIPIFP